MSNFFNIRAVAGTIVLEIFGQITEYDMFEEYLRWQISEMGNDAPLAVRMSSPGGDPRIAMSLYRIIKDHEGPSTCYIEYMCDSAVTLIACACDEVIGNRFPFEYMIHDPKMQPEWFGVEEGEALLEFLNQVRDDMVRIYVERSGQSEDAIRTMMKDTTFMNAQEALDFGFIDEIKEVQQTLDAKVDYKIAANAFADVRPKEFKIEGRGQSPATSKQKQTTGSIMSDSKTWLEKLRASFGLGDTADEADVVLSAKTLKADLQAKDTEIKTLQGEIESKDKEITQLKADLEEAKGKLPSEEEEEAKANQEVEDQLEAAVKDFKIQAAQKEKMAEDYKGNPEGLKKVLAYIPEGAVKASKNVGKPKTKARAVVGGLNEQVAKDLGVE